MRWACSVGPNTEIRTRRWCWRMRRVFLFSFLSSSSGGKALLALPSAGMRSAWRRSCILVGVQGSVDYQTRRRGSSLIFPTLQTHSGAHHPRFLAQDDGHESSSRLRELRCVISWDWLTILPFFHNGMKNLALGCIILLFHVRQDVSKIRK